MKKLSLKLLAEKLPSLTKLFVKKIFNRGFRIISKFLFSYKKLMYETSIVLKNNKFQFY